MRHPPGRSKAPRFRPGERVQVLNNRREATVVYEQRARRDWYRVAYHDTGLTAMRPAHLLRKVGP